MDVLADLEARGLIHDSTDRAALGDRLADGPVTLYCGFDPTADSLHIGNLVGLVTLRRFQLGGHRPIALAGGATGMVGDPGGRSEERNLLDEHTLATNLEAIKGQIQRILGPEGAWSLVDNRTWTAQLSLLEFLRDVGKHMTVNQMMAKESVRTRLDSTSGISYTEFSYMLLQANDYWWLNAHHDCELQVGGSDQWGNITAGIDLIRRRGGGAVHGLTWPLVTRSDGSKFGKSAQGDNIWLDPGRTSPYRFFQYWMQTDDADVDRYLRQLTLLSVAEIEAVVEAHGEEPEKRAGQRTLALAVTSLVHGQEAARAAEAASAVLFGSGIEGVDAATLAAIDGEVPTIVVPRARLEAGVAVVELLVESGAASSRGDARRLVEGGAVSVNDSRVVDPRAAVTTADTLHYRYLLIRRGRAYHLVVAGE